MTGRQLHSIVHRLTVVAWLERDAETERFCGNIAKSRRLRAAARTIDLRVHRDLGRWMSPATNRSYGAAAAKVLAHLQHANAKRNAVSIS